MISLSTLLTGCGPSPGQLAIQAEQSRLDQLDRASDAATRACGATYPPDQRSRINAVPFAKCMNSAYEQRGRKTDLLEAMNFKRLELAEKLSAGKITVAEYMSQLSSFRSEVISQYESRYNQAQMVAAAQSTARSANCAVVQQRTANSDYSGVNSTNGVVAVASLLAAVGDGVAQARACD